MRKWSVGLTPYLGEPFRIRMHCRAGCGQIFKSYQILCILNVSSSDTVFAQQSILIVTEVRHTQVLYRYLGLCLAVKVISSTESFVEALPPDFNSLLSNSLTSNPPICGYSGRPERLEYLFSERLCFGHTTQKSRPSLWANKGLRQVAPLAGALGSCLLPNSS